MKEMKRHNKKDSLENFENEKKRISSTYNITQGQACCYICNYRGKYFCETFNMGCSQMHICRDIYGKENFNMQY